MKKFALTLAHVYVSFRFCFEIVSVGPIIAGCALRLVHGDKFNIMWPFHNESKAILCVHMFIGTMFTVFPVGYGVWLLLQ